MSCLQLELFPKTELDLLREEVIELKKSLGNVRRGIFSRQEDLVEAFQATKEREEKLHDAINQLRERLDHYEEALFPELGVELSAGGADLVVPGLRSMLMPVSSLMTSSHASSTGLSLPKK